MSTPRPDIPPTGLSRDEYVEVNVNRQLDSEGDAAFENARYQEEIANIGTKSDQIGYAGKQDSKYQAIYDDYKAGKISEDEARYQMGQLFAQEGVSGTNNVNYRDKLTAQYEEQWAKYQREMQESFVAD